MRKNSFNKAEIINKVQAVDALFKKASEKIENEKIKIKITEISSVNEKFINSLYDEISENKHKISKGKIDRNNSVENIEFLGQREILRLCLKKEEELVKMYQKAISYYQLSKAEDVLYKNQFYNSLIHFNQMKMAEEAMHYQNQL